jgi:hypothetical protein
MGMAYMGWGVGCMGQLGCGLHGLGCGLHGYLEEMRVEALDQTFKLKLLTG